MVETHLRKTALIRYGLMALPLSFAGLPIYLHAPDFYASQINVSLASIGFILLILRLIDAIQDPVIGSLSDRFISYRKSILLGGIALLGSGFWMLFHPLSSHPLLWFGLSIFICTTGFSVVTINYQTLGALWQTSTHERTRITGWREGFGLIGLLIASIAPTLLGVIDDPAGAFHKLSLFYIPLLIIAGFVLFKWINSTSFDAPRQSKKNLNIKAWFDTPWKKHFFGLHILNSIGSSIPAVLVIFFIRDRLDAEAYTGLFLMLYFISGALSMFFWQRLAKNVGKYKCWGISMALAIATFVWAAFLAQGDSILYGIICILSGMALGADLAIPPSILADYIANKDEQNVASRYFSVMAFLSKGALAIATGVTLPMLEWLGYQPGQITNYETTNALSFSYAVLPCLVKIVVIVWLWRCFSILKKEH